MDNLNTNTDPSGEAGATASQGQSDATETQLAEGTDEISQGVSDAQGMEDGQEASEASNPWDNDPKFKGKSAEDIYTAYREQEKVVGQVSQKAEIANLLEEKYGITPEQLKEQIEQQEYQERQERYAGNPLAPVLDEVKQLKNIVLRQEQEKALQAEEKELDNFLKDNPDYQPFKDKILKLGLLDENHNRSYEELANEWFGQSRAQGQQDAYKKIETKKLTQATKPTSAPKKRITIEDMETMPIEDLREFYGVK